MAGFCYLLGLLLLAASIPFHAAKRFRDVANHGGAAASAFRHQDRLQGWSPDQNIWNEKLYPVWREGDSRWKSCWKGGQVRAILTSDSPALVGSNITFVVSLVFPRCQKEVESGDIVYDQSCKNDTASSSDSYVYNWTMEERDWGKCPNRSTHHVFPDGKPFPCHPGWKKKNFVYIFHTLGQYFPKLGRSSAAVSINTANMPLGPQLMEVNVYRRGHKTYVPVASTRDIYTITDEIPVFVNMSQKNDRNSSDDIFIKDLPILFDVHLHDPSHFLNTSAIHYKWKFGDNSGLFVSSSAVFNHTYTLNGSFILNLTVQAAVPGPCPGPSPSPPTPTSPHFIVSTVNSSYAAIPLPPGAGLQDWRRDAPDGSCQIIRYGHFTASLTIVEGILEVNIIQMTNIQKSMSQTEDSAVDFVVTCQGNTLTDVCTVISDPTCQWPQNTVCDPVEVNDQCLLTIRRAFRENGMYCVNLTLGNEASLALTSTLVSISGKAPGSPSRAGAGILVSIGALVIFTVVLTFFVYKRYKEFKLIESCPGKVGKNNGLDVSFHKKKTVFFPANNEKDPLLKREPGIV
ncbi:transmembrane glycoprotein NMB [Sarcophilus harrisii]|uniref:Transmembrane glycoprotein NMB n=1 Tax=Sarcophilus harrisii TaxID=9305 RepID=G3W1A5_SARHA|nr:transmembrane glycoprotein NMB [Sarcophilus harrisii]XP_012406878.1 transmembrane glycoprotein NMB [Sarcophilus harrisii]XP_023361016.1 transmembrane glycoprotein NMB [Sarcophilus harrisii]